MAITEYNLGGCWDITGGIAETDILGIFGKYGVYASTYWSLGNGTETYTSLAFKIYRNYDGNNSTFGDTHVQALMNDTVNSSIYASVFQADQSQLHIIAINKNMTQTIQGNFTIDSLTTFHSADAYTVSSSSSSILGPVTFALSSSNFFTYNLPPLTIAHFVLKTSIVDIPHWEKYGMVLNRQFAKSMN